jgi:hypothetical protein
VAFLDELPMWAGRRELRQALAAVCSNALPGDVLHVTREQLLGAIAVSSGDER